MYCHKRIRLRASQHMHISSYFSGGGETWGMKDEKFIIGEGVRGAKPPRSQSIFMPEKEMEIIFVTRPMDS